MKKNEQILWKHKMEIIKEHVHNLGWDYDRLSSNGQDVYEKLCVILNVES